MDQSRIDSNKTKVVLAPFALAGLLNDLKATYEPRAIEKSLGFKLEIEGRVPRQIVSDCVCLRQILDSVISNSLKFTEHGAVQIKVAYRNLHDNGSLIFQVSDTGCGLSEFDIKRLFQPVLPQDSATSQRLGGEGLSLLIARHIAELLGGDLVLLRSQPEAGSSFQISVNPGPVDDSQCVDGAQILSEERGQRAASLLDSSPRLDDRRVLVVDDSADNRNLMVRVISRFGALVETACDGAEAIEKALHGNFDVVLMDIQMPGTDGYEATAQLRRRGYRKPILALTAHAMQEDRGRCREVGCDDHIAKPVNLRILMQSIADHMHRYEVSTI